MSNPCKEITMEVLINNASLDRGKGKNDDVKTVYTAVELMALGDNEPKYLMPPIFPQIGTAVLSGKPDIGKSQLARQLCIHVALGEETFLDFELNFVHKRAIYVATEDNREATRYLMGKQFEGLGKEPVENFRVMVADTMNQKQILKRLDKELKKLPADIVVVDSFGDIFEGEDSNKNMAMRKTVRLFDQIANRHSCLILFVHHVNKAAYRQSPGQEQIQGGSGLVQKVRLAIILFEGEGNKRYFSVVKGNYCPKSYKEKSLELLFSEETFLFTNTGKMIPTSELGTQSGSVGKKDITNEYEKAADMIFEDSTMSYSDFTEQYQELTGKSEVTGKRVIEKLTKTCYIVKVDGGYRLRSAEKTDEQNTTAVEGDN